ncbi:MAG: hypothetical protein QM820_54825 [Minicystis sp.]
MTTKADYSNEEWELLCAGPHLAGLGISLLDPGLVSGLQESTAIAHAIRDAKATYADNALVQAVIAAIDEKGDHNKHPEGETSETVLEKLQKIDALLDKKGQADEATLSEGIVYRNFLYQVADRAANAAGGFMGLGEKVSEEERYYLHKLKEILFREPAAS